MRSLRILFTLMSLAGLTVLIASAQDHRWFHFAPNDRILSMAEDGGNLWVHTLDGLVKFDMAEGQFEYFDKTNSQIGSEYIHGLARVGGGGTVIIVTYDLGVLSITNDQWTYHDTLNSPLPANDVISVGEDQQGNAWMITQSVPALVRYDGQQWQTYTIPDSGFQDISQTVFVDHHDQIWVGTQSRLLSFNGTLWKDHSAALKTAGVALPAVEYVYEDRQLRLWVNIAGALYRRDSVENWQFIDLGYASLSMSEDASGQIWLTRQQSGSYELLRYEEASQSMVLVDTANSAVPFNTYASLYHDSGNKMWMGGFPGNLTRYQNGNWQSYDLANSQIKFRKAADISRDSAGNVYMLREDALHIYDGQSWQIQHFSEHLGDQLAVRNSSQYWILDRSEQSPRLSAYSDQQWTSYATQLFGSGARPGGLGLDGKDNLWIHEAHSLYRLVQEQWIHYTENHGLLPPGLNIAAASVAPQGGIWFTDSAASQLWYFDGQTVSSFSNPLAGNPSQAPIRMHADELGNVWLYNNRHLQRFDGQQFTEILNGGSLWNGINALSSAGDTLIISSQYAVLFYHQNTLTTLDPYNSPLRTGWPGKVIRDETGNFWINNRWKGLGGISLFNPEGVVYSDDRTTASIGANSILAANTFSLYPNPAGQAVSIRYELLTGGEVSLEIYDFQGRRMARLLDTWQPSGTYEHRFSRSGLSPGMYFVRLYAGGAISSQKLIITSQ